MDLHRYPFVKEVNIYHNGDDLMRYLTLNHQFEEAATLIPFTTRWVGAAPNETLPELFYTLDLFLWSLCFQLMDHQIVKDNPGIVRDETNGFVFRATLYCTFIVAIVLAFILLIGSLVVIGLIDVAWFFLVDRSYWHQDK